MSEALPISIAAWLRAYLEGAEPGELLPACLRRLRRHSPAGTWIHMAGDAELEAQVRALQAMRAGLHDTAALLERHPLFGVPFAVKDNIDIAGVPTTAACPAYSRIAAVSAAAVLKLQEAGAVWLGKTNLDQFATGLVGTRSPYGRPASVFSAEHISGGSSSGSAIAVAAGLVAFALGTDTAGSGRVPAAFNQIVGLKPTPGRVSTSGVVPACRSLDCLSVFALTVQEAEHVLSIVEGPDAHDGYSDFHPGPAAWPRQRLRIGVPAALKLAPEGEYARCYRQAAEGLRGLGHDLVELDFEDLHQVAGLLYEGPWVVERFGVVREQLERDPVALDPAVRDIIESARRFEAIDVFRAQYQLRAAQARAARIWEQVDLLMVPSAPLHPRFGDIAANPLGINRTLGTYTNFVNLLGWCALALPAGNTAQGLPFGVCLIAPAHHDAALAEFGRTWQDALGLAPGRPGLAPGGQAGDAGLLRRAARRETLPIAVVGAHLSGFPLNGQLLDRGARLLREARTSARYRLHVLPDSLKPGLVRSDKGSAIALEIWDMPLAELGRFVAQIAPPLGLGSIELADGSWVHGFLCEAHALAQAEDISAHGGWRAYVQSQRAATPGGA